MKLLQEKSKALFVGLDETKETFATARFEPVAAMLQGKNENRTGGYREEPQKPEVFASLLDRKRYGMRVCAKAQK